MYVCVFARAYARIYVYTYYYVCVCRIRVRRSKCRRTDIRKGAFVNADKLLSVKEYKTEGKKRRKKPM